MEGRFLQAEDVNGLRAHPVPAEAEDGRRPAPLAREVTSLDLVVGGRGEHCVTAPFEERLLVAIGLCPAMWREGRTDSEGPHFPVSSAVDWPRPVGDPAACRVERV